MAGRAPGEKRNARRREKMKKLLKIVFIGIPVLIIVVLVVIYFALNSIVEAGVEQVGPMVTKTDVSMESISISPFSGRGEITQFVLGNPEGFKSESAIKAKNIIIEVELKSLMSDVIIVNEMIVEYPEITYEASLITGSNVSKILDNIDEFTQKLPGGGEEEEEEAPAEEEGAQKKIIIKYFAVREGKVRVVSKDLLGAGVVSPLPLIEEKDIGAETNGVTLGEAASRALGLIFKSAGNVGKDSMNLAGDGAKVTGDAVEGAAKKVGDTIKGIFGGKKEE
jgi:hypothetical protein